MSKKQSNPDPPKRSKDNMQKYIEMLGFKACDKVTGFKGVLTSLSFDLYGCIQFVIDPEIDKDGKRGTGHWFDVNRIKVTGTKPVMEMPAFRESAEDTPGPAEKPLP